MSSSLVLAEIRNLRRYAFSLLGNRALADMTVEAAIEKTLSSMIAAPSGTVSRLDLYKTVNDTIRRKSHIDNVTAVPTAGIHTRLLRLPLKGRQVAALHDVAGLSYRDIASIMSMAEMEARQTYVASLAELRHEPVAVLIIEDEAMVAMELCRIVTGLGLSVAGTAANRADAMRIAGRMRPRLILADYNLLGDSGIDIVKAIRKRYDTNVIYVTAYPDKVAARLETGRDIIIGKPFTARALAHAVETHLAA